MFTHVRIACLIIKDRPCTINLKVVLLPVGNRTRQVVLFKVLGMNRPVTLVFGTQTSMLARTEVVLLINFFSGQTVVIA